MLCAGVVLVVVLDGATLALAVGGAPAVGGSDEDTAFLMDLGVKFEMKSPASSTDSLVVRTVLLADVACILVVVDASVAATAPATVSSDN